MFKENVLASSSNQFSLTFFYQSAGDSHVKCTITTLFCIKHEQSVLSSVDAYVVAFPFYSGCNIVKTLSK